MVCVACNKKAKQNETNDCFETALDTLRQHYDFYKNSIKKRDTELFQLKQRNEELLKALELLQKSQQPAKRFKPNDNKDTWLSPNNNKQNIANDNSQNDQSITTDEDELAAAGASNLNIALNSEQLFETSVLSPAPNATCSEIAISPRIKESPRRNKQREDQCNMKNKSKLLQRSKTEWYSKERFSPSDKSWASRFVQPILKIREPENVGEIKKPEKKLNLSLKKVNPSKIKQTLLNFDNSKNASNVESDAGEDIIDASPVVPKTSKAGRSWAQRSGLSHSIDQNNTTNLVEEENKQTHENSSSISIDNIVFDFSPSKKSESQAVSDRPMVQPLSCKQLKFEKSKADEITDIDCSGRSDSSSVVLLTPATQDIIFVDDTCNEVSGLDTMDLLAEVRKHDNTENLTKLKQFESKNFFEISDYNRLKSEPRSSTHSENSNDSMADWTYYQGLPDDNDIKPSDLNPATDNTILGFEETSSGNSKINISSLDAASNSMLCDALASNSNSYIEYHSLLKPIRKGKKHTENWRKRNSGQEYEMHTKNKKIRPERQIKAPCGETCRHECFKNFSEEDRQLLFSFFWSLGDIEKQRQFIANSMDFVKPKYRYVRTGGIRGPRHNNNAFFFRKGEGFVRVCKLFFRNTLDITDRVIRTVLEKREKMSHQILECDQRGKHGRRKKIN